MSARWKVVGGIAIAVLAGMAYQVFGTATVAITSEPAGAVIRVDGRQRGLTPRDRLELDTGGHRLEVVHSHFKPHVESLRLSRGDHVKRHIVFTPGEGTFELLSNPRGAWVEVDGERLPERTPTRITLPSGEHLIAMGQAERHIVEEQHTVKHGQTLEVNFNLNIDPHGSLTVATSPRDARVELLGEDLPYKPKMRLQIGEYAMRVSRPGYVTQEFRYTVRYGDNLHDVTLERDYGMLRVAVEPAGAEVSVRYTDGGRQKRQSLSTAALRVPVGDIEVRARALGYRTAFKKAYLDNQGAVLRFSLEPMSVAPGSTFADPIRGAGKGPEMVVIPAGRFLMGDASGPPSERPVREVTLTQPFAVSKYEITVGDFLPYLEARGKPVPEKLDISDPRQALAYVTFADAEGYADWLSDRTGERYRLLSEAEWEYVARAGSTSHYFWGDDPLELCRYANIADRATRTVYRDWDTLSCDDGQVRVGPVGRYAPNPFGLHDIYGNVAEWVADCGMPEYADAPADGGPAMEGGGCGSHGVRGGSWDSRAAEARSSYRNTASSANDDRGIRLLREL